mgnify:FL=1
MKDYLPDKDKLTEISRSFLLMVSIINVSIAIYNKNRNLWDKLVKITEEIDDFMSSKNKNEFGLNLNKSFYESLKGFKPLKSMRTRRSRISKIKKSKVIEKNMQSDLSMNFNQNNMNENVIIRNYHDS